MRAIKKRGQPAALIQWKAANAASPQNLFYGGGDFPGEAVRRSLLSEQHHLCAYTLRRLKTATACEEDGQDTTASCHIDHLLPQCRKVTGEDIDYQNMVACYPPSQSKVACEYGAVAKADYDPSKGGFVSPLSPVVESHFEFDEKGGVKGLSDDGAATIAVLKLDHKTLVNDRAAVIRGYLSPKGKKVSAQAARRLADEIMKTDGKQCLHAYCVAVAQSALRYAEREERRSARLKRNGQV